MHLVGHNEVEIKTKTEVSRGQEIIEKSIPEPVSKAQVDVVSQLKANLNQLEDLHARLRFVAADIRQVIKARR